MPMWSVSIIATRWCNAADFFSKSQSPRIWGPIDNLLTVLRDAIVAGGSFGFRPILIREAAAAASAARRHAHSNSGRVGAGVAWHGTRPSRFGSKFDAPLWNRFHDRQIHLLEYSSSSFASIIILVIETVTPVDAFDALRQEFLSKKNARNAVAAFLQRSSSLPRYVGMRIAYAIRIFNLRILTKLLSSLQLRPFLKAFIPWPLISVKPWLYGFICWGCPVRVAPPSKTIRLRWYSLAS